jgi:hypothetical protein
VGVAATVGAWWTGVRVDADGVERGGGGGEEGRAEEGPGGKLMRLG